MGFFNKVMLLGNVTRDPELRALPNDNKVCDFGLAANRRYRTAAGEEREETLFIDCAAFGRQAEVLHEYVTRGRPLFVEGRLKLDTWEDRQSGQKRSKISVVVENFQFVGPRDEARSETGEGAGSRSAGRESREDSGGEPRREARRSKEGGGAKAPAGKPLEGQDSEEDGGYAEDIPF